MEAGTCLGAMFWASLITNYEFRTQHRGRKTSNPKAFTWGAVKSCQNIPLVCYNGRQIIAIFTVRAHISAGFPNRAAQRLLCFCTETHIFRDTSLRVRWKASVSTLCVLITLLQ